MIHVTPASAILALVCFVLAEVFIAKLKTEPTFLKARLWGGFLGMFDILVLSYLIGRIFGY